MCQTLFCERIASSSDPAGRMRLPHVDYQEENGLPQDEELSNHAPGMSSALKTDKQTSSSLHASSVRGGRVLVFDSCCIIIDYAVFASHGALGVSYRSIPYKSNARLEP